VQVSTLLTLGTADANGQPTRSLGFVRLDTLVGDPSTSADEADVSLAAGVNDVRKAADLSDYVGELQVRLSLRITDRDNAPAPGGAGPGTVTDTTFPFTLPCSATADTSVGATCSVTTTADVVLPGVIVEGKRAVWELGQVIVLDGGEDGLASTADNLPFLSQGLFVP
jgi:hypothetical protein